MNDEEYEERKTTTITKTGLSVELTRTSKGTYKWTIQVDVPGLDEEELLKRLDRIDKALRRRFLKEEVEKKGEEEVVKEEKPLRTIPLRRRGGRSLLGRIAIYEDKISLEPLNPLPIKDAAVGWFLGFLEGRFGKEKVNVEKTPSLERFKRITIQAKISDQDLKQVRRKAAWSFEKALEREAEKQ